MGTWRRAQETIRKAEQLQREMAKRRAEEREMAEAAEQFAREAARRRK